MSRVSFGDREDLARNECSYYNVKKAPRITAGIALFSNKRNTRSTPNGGLFCSNTRRMRCRRSTVANKQSIPCVMRLSFSFIQHQKRWAGSV